MINLGTEGTFVFTEIIVNSTLSLIEIMNCKQEYISARVPNSYRYTEQTIKSIKQLMNVLTLK